MARARPARGDASTDAVVKVVFGLGYLLLVSLSQSLAFLLLAAATLLALLALERAELIAQVLLTAVAVSAFTALILLPSAFLYGPVPALRLVARVFLSVVAVRLVGARTGWAGLSGAFKRLFIPDLFILVFDVAIRYITLLGGFALSMLYALRLRSVGRNPGKGAALFGVAGTLFLRSKEQAEELLSAMECRGFEGEYRVPRRGRLGARDGLLLLLLFGLVAAFLLLRGAR